MYQIFQISHLLIKCVQRQCQNIYSVDGPVTVFNTIQYSAVQKYLNLTIFFKE